MNSFLRFAPLLIALAPRVGLGAAYPVVWTEPAPVDYLRVSSTGDGVTSSLSHYDLIFVLLKQPIINPANCNLDDKYAFIPESQNGKEDIMYSTLLAAAMSERNVQLAISTQYCDNLHPTIYDVKISF